MHRNSWTNTCRVSTANFNDPNSSFSTTTSILNPPNFGYTPLHNNWSLSLSFTRWSSTICCAFKHLVFDTLVMVSEKTLNISCIWISCGIVMIFLNECRLLHIHSHGPQWDHPCGIRIHLPTIAHVVQSAGKKTPNAYVYKTTPLVGPLQNAATR